MHFGKLARRSKRDGVKSRLQAFGVKYFVSNSISCLPPLVVARYLVLTV